MNCVAVHRARFTVACIAPASIVANVEIHMTTIGADKMTRNNHMHMLAIGLVVATGAALAQQADGLTAPQVRAQLEAHGYTDINDVKFDDGMWEADAKSANGNRIELRIDAKTGEVFPDEQIANLGEADVQAKLAAAGYTNVHDVDYDDGMWKAEGDDPAGKDVEIRLDPRTGEIVGKEKD